MKAKDITIISFLRRNARMSLTKISRRTNIPVSTIFERLKANEGTIIEKHASLLNFEKMGYNTNVNILLKVDREDKNSLREFLLRHPSVNSAYRISNGYDFAVEGVFKQIKDMDDFLEEIESNFRIHSKKYFFIIENIKRETFMSNPTVEIDST